MVLKLGSGEYEEHDLLFLVNVLKLDCIEVIVGSTLGHEARVSARFKHFSIVDHCYAVGIVDSGETVSDHDACPALPGLVQSILHILLTLCVQGRGGLVQEEDFGVPHQSTGDGNALFLTSRQLGTLTTHISVETL